MQSHPLIIALVVLTAVHSSAAEAKGRRGSSSSSSHSTGQSHFADTAGSVASGAGRGLSSYARSSGAGASSGDSSSDTGGFSPTATGKANSDRQAVAASATLGLRVEEASADLARQKKLEEAARAAEEARVRREAEQREAARQEAIAEKKVREKAWAARCNLQPVMSDLEIATCKEVWSKPAPKTWPGYPGPT